MGDVSRRRGNLQGTSMKGSSQIIRAEIPMSEMFGYATDLRSNTQGRGSFSMELSHYADVPRNVAEKIIGDRKKN